jgi:hypothetical protein
MTRRVEGWFSLFVLLLVVGLAFVARGLREEPPAHAGSAASTRADGRRGFFLLLQELGFAPVEWRSAPGKLPRGEHLLWMPQRPHSWIPHGEGSNQVRVPVENLLPEHGLEHYRNFVEQGGTLIAPLDKEMLEFLRDELELPGAESLEFAGAGERGPRRVRLESGEQLELELDPARALRPLPPGSAARELWILENQPGATGPEALEALEIPCGSGRVVLLGEDGFLDNGKLRDAQHALAGVRLVEQFARGRQILFDEYCLGQWEPQSAFALSASPPVFLLSLHALALLVLFVWSRSFARAFPRDPPPLAAASPLERAEALARLWKSGARQRLAARALGRAAAARPARRQASAELETLARELEAPSAPRR